MKKNIFKKIIVSVLSLSLMFSFAGPVSAARSHAANGSNVMPSSGKWVSFSVRDDLNYNPPGPKTDWGKALDVEIQKALDQALADYKAGKIIVLRPIGSIDIGLDIIKMPYMKRSIHHGFILMMSSL